MKKITFFSPSLVFMVFGFSGFSRFSRTILEILLHSFQVDSAQDNDVALFLGRWKKLSHIKPPLYIPYNFLNFFLPIFLQQYTTVPQTPLLTSQVLKEETEQWPEVQQEMSMALKVQYS